jgi:hypothetical protein
MSPVLLLAAALLHSDEEMVDGHVVLAEDRAMDPGKPCRTRAVHILAVPCLVLAVTLPYNLLCGLNHNKAQDFYNFFLSWWRAVAATNH